jgi:uncharacterized protein (TIGR02996 family)
MSAERESLLAAIRESADDDTPRLVFADWLDEHGEPDLAAFIRLEIERDRLPRSDPQWNLLNEQARSLRKKVPADFRAAGALYLTRRGFPYDVQTSLVELRDGIDRLGPYTPRLKLLLGGDTAAEQEAEEAYARGGLDLLGEAFQQLFASPWVRNWESLEMQNLRLTADRALAMTAPGNLTRLEVLHLQDTADDEAVRVLGSANLPRLWAFEIFEVRRRTGWDDPLLTPAVVGIILESPLLDRLEHLSLCGNWLGNDQLRAIAGSPRMAGLKSFYPWPVAGSTDGLLAILRSPNLAGLTWLNLSRIGLEPEIVELLERPEVLPNLTRLDIDDETEPVIHERLSKRFGKGLIGGPLEDNIG